MAKAFQNSKHIRDRVVVPPVFPVAHGITQNLSHLATEGSRIDGGAAWGFVWQAEILAQSLQLG